MASISVNCWGEFCMLYSGLRLRAHANGVVAWGDLSSVNFSDILCYQQGLEIFFLNRYQRCHLGASYFPLKFWERGRRWSTRTYINNVHRTTNNYCSATFRHCDVTSNYVGPALNLWAPIQSDWKQCFKLLIDCCSHVTYQIIMLTINYEKLQLKFGVRTQSYFHLEKWM